MIIDVDNAFLVSPSVASLLTLLFAISNLFLPPNFLSIFILAKNFVFSIFMSIVCGYFLKISNLSINGLEFIKYFKLFLLIKKIFSISNFLILFNRILFSF